MQLEYLVKAYGYCTVTVLQCEAVRKNTMSEIQNNENCNFISEYSDNVSCLVSLQ